VIHVGVGEEYAVEAVNASVVWMAPVTLPHARFVSAEIIAVDSLQRREKPHPQKVPQPQRGAAGPEELLVKAASDREVGAEVEEVASMTPLEKDLVAADLAGFSLASRTPEHRDRNHRSIHNAEVL
jgi:hypothetical protein